MATTAQRAVIASTSVALPDGVTKGLYIGVTGDVACDMADGSYIVYKNLASGVVHPLSVKRIYATGTTATNIVAVY